MTATQTLSAIAREKAIMVVRAPNPEAAEAAIGAAVEGGMRVIEVTFTVPGAVEIIRKLAADPRLIVGAGTVLRVEEARASLQAGARFIVSPGLDDAVVEYVVGADALMLPGVFTPTEVLRALQLGVPGVKLFPADRAGPEHLKALRGPLPDLQVVPSGGVNAGNARAWLEAGAVAVGLAGSLSPSTADPDLEAITAEARRVIEAVSASPHHNVAEREKS